MAKRNSILKDHDGNKKDFTDELTINQGTERQRIRRSFLIKLLQEASSKGLSVTLASFRKYLDDKLKIPEMQNAEEGEKLSEVVSFHRNTFHSDIAFLKDLGAPISYDPSAKAYLLENPHWCGYHTTVPEDEMQALMVGVHIALSILPQSELRTQIAAAAFSLSSGNYVDYRNLDTHAVVIDQAQSLVGKEEIFMVIFRQWFSRHNVTITYRNSKDRISKLTVEPHFLTFTENNWYLQANCHLGKNDSQAVFRSFALKRIQSATPDSQKFNRNVKEFNKLQNGNIFNFDLLEGVRLALSAEAKNQCAETLPILVSHPDSERPDILIAELAPVQEHIVTKFVMKLPGKVSVLAPAGLRKKIRADAEAIMSANN